MLALLCTSQEHYHRKGNSKYSTNGMDELHIESI